MKARTSATIFMISIIPVSCSDTNCGLERDATTADVLFSCGEPSVRSDISSLAVFAFTEDGEIANSTVSTGNTAIMKVPEKRLKCYAVVNPHDPMDGIITESELLSKVSYLKNNSPEAFEMSGHATADIRKSKKVSIDVERFCAMLKLGNVSLKWKSQYSYPELRITGIFAENIVPACLYSFSTASVPAGSWINKMKWESNLGGLAGSQENIILKNGESVNCNKSFFVYPNPTAEDIQGKTPFSARHTRLVIEVLCGDKRWYYPISIPDIRSNTCYYLDNLIITGPGSENPDIEVSRSIMGFDLRVSSWGTNYSFEESM